MAKRTKLISSVIICTILLSCRDSSEKKQIQYSEKNDVFVIIDGDSSKIEGGQNWKEFKDSLEGKKDNNY